MLRIILAAGGLAVALTTVASASKVGDSGVLNGNESNALIAAYRGWVRGAAGGAATNGAGSDFYARIEESTSQVVVGFGVGSLSQGSQSQQLFAVQKKDLSVAATMSGRALPSASVGVDGDIIRALVAADQFMVAKSNPSSLMLSDRSAGNFTESYVRRPNVVAVSVSFVYNPPPNAIDGCVGKSFEVSISDFSVREVKGACE